MKFRKLLPLFLFLILCAGITAYADQDGYWTYEMTSGGLKITAYTGQETDVVIPDEIGGYLVTTIAGKALADNYTMRSLTIPEGISSIGGEAFRGCTGLSRIVFNAKNCTVPDVWVYDGSKGAGVFSGAGSSSADGLTVVFGPKVTKIPDNLFNTASTAEYGLSGFPFAYVTAVEFPETLKEIGANAFRSCQLLEAVSLGDAVKRIGSNAFQGCTGLISLSLGGDLAYIDPYAFESCTALHDISWGGGLDTIGASAFANCSSIETLDLPVPLNMIERNAFNGCIGLTALTLPEGLTGIQAQAFCGCVKLNSITINSEKLTVPDIWIYDDSKGAGVFSGAGSSSPGGLSVAFGPKVVRVADHLFDTASISGEYGISGFPYAYVTSVMFSDSVKEIGSCAFRGCQVLEEVTFGAGLTAIEGNAFQLCRALPAVAFPDKLASIGDYAFQADDALEEISWGASMDSIGAFAFADCISLEELELTVPLTTLKNDAFDSCTGLKSLVLPESLTNIGAEAFADCIKLAEITINCENLTAPEVWIYDGSKGAGVFSGIGSALSGGTKVSFGETVGFIPAYLFETASQEEYGKAGFAYAYITSVTIPASVKEIGEAAFCSCQNLEDVIFEGADAEFGERVFDGCTASGFGIASLPGGSIEVYAGEKGIRYTAAEPAAEPQTEAAVEPFTREAEEKPGAEAAGTWTCPNGHAGNTLNFCPECGAKRPENACSACGEEFPEGSSYKFCPNCGAPVE